MYRNTTDKRRKWKKISFWEQKFRPRFTYLRCLNDHFERNRWHVKKTHIKYSRAIQISNKIVLNDFLSRVISATMRIRIVSKFNFVGRFAIT